MPHTARGIAGNLSVNTTATVHDYWQQRVSLTRNAKVSEKTKTCPSSSLTSNGLGLLKHHLLRNASFALIQLLSNAGDDSQALSESMSHLLPDQLGTAKKTGNQSARPAPAVVR